MGFDPIAALVAGFVATVVMDLLMTMAAAMGVTRMPPMSLISGSMMAGNRRTAWAIGAMVHFVVMGAVVFGFIYAALFAVFGTPGAAAWWVGALIGLVHGVVVGGMVMPMMPAMHPRMEPLPAGVGGTPTVSEQPGDLRLSAPGFMGKDWGALTPMGVVAGHVAYGVVLGLIYALITA